MPRNNLVTSAELVTKVLARGLKLDLRGFQASAHRALEDWVAGEVACPHCSKLPSEPVSSTSTATHEGVGNKFNAGFALSSTAVLDLKAFIREAVKEVFIELRVGQDGPGESTSDREGRAIKAAKTHLRSVDADRKAKGVPPKRLPGTGKS